MTLLTGANWGNEAAMEVSGRSFARRNAEGSSFVRGDDGLGNHNSQREEG